MNPSRKPLSGCEWWIGDNSPAGGSPCGKAAVAKWIFEAGEDHPAETILVCEQHDQETEKWFDDE